MTAKQKANARKWIETWLDGVAQGSATMSQRTLASIEAKVGLAAARKAAKARGVHLLQLTDDRGVALVAAGLHPFKVVC